MKNAQIEFSCDLYVSRDEETIKLIDCDITMHGSKELAEVTHDLGKAGVNAMIDIVLMRILSQRLNLNVEQILEDLCEEHQDLYKL
jgi:hypothetical protein